MIHGWKHCGDEIERAMKRDRKTTLAQQFSEIGRSLRAFDIGPSRYLSKTVIQAGGEAKEEFDRENYDDAEFLLKVLAFLIKREARICAADQRRWMEKCGGQSIRQALVH